MQYSDFKSKDINLSAQVQKELQKRGYSHIFNKPDFDYYKKLTRKEFYQEIAIVELFIQNAEVESDFNEYIF